ncbi:MAG TPA: hypothetical protein VLA97_14305 [Nocardioidaceae bacterium]|jgi:hypothetical protein|nr:hypothetical protein [Nocardioidaceae bacterium]
MDEREIRQAQAEALKGTAGETSESTRKRIAEGLNRYLMSEARHTSKARRTATEKKVPPEEGDETTRTEQ